MNFQIVFKVVMSQFQRVIKTTKFLRNFSRLNNISWLEKNKGIIIIGIDSNYKNVINHVSVNPKDYLTSKDDIIHLNFNDYIQPVRAPFDCRIISENINIQELLNSKLSTTSDLWIVKIEPVKFNSVYNIIENENYKNLNSPYPMTELLYFL